MESRRRTGLVVALSLVAMIVGVSGYVYGTTAPYAWFAYGPPFTVPPPRPLSLQVLRGLGVLLAAAGLVGVVVAIVRRRRLRVVSG